MALPAAVGLGLGLGLLNGVELRIGVAQRGARLCHRLEERFQFAESPPFGVGACGGQPGLEA